MENVILSVILLFILDRLYWLGYKIGLRTKNSRVQKERFERKIYFWILVIAYLSIIFFGIYFPIENPMPDSELNEQKLFILLFAVFFLALPFRLYEKGKQDKDIKELIWWNKKIILYFTPNKKIA